MKPVLTMEELKSIRDQRHGFVNTHFPPPDGKNNLLHSATCTALRRMNLTYPKFFSESLDEAEEWLTTRYGEEDMGWRRCGRCKATEALSGSSSSRSEDPFREDAVEAILYEHLRELGYSVEEKVSVPSGIVDAVAIRNDEQAWSLKLRVKMQAATPRPR